ncbi:hypothetical protein P7K49_033843 [Saguinus oedipus]|uniref:Uncharacterized protein n=1 Tax=Saguinus oedipus TaxID=9490 RepID=A0ABQ9TTI7_SAGOE|nr:hypothetical protein P7K49_033843 [Saguinus oedipus]
MPRHLHRGDLPPAPLKRGSHHSFSEARWDRVASSAGWDRATTSGRHGFCSLGHDASSAPWDRAATSCRRFRSLRPHRHGFCLLQRRRGFCRHDGSDPSDWLKHHSILKGPRLGLHRSSLALPHRLSLCPAPEVDERHPVSPPGSGALEITGVEPCGPSPEISSLCLGSFQDLPLPDSGPQLCDPQRKRPGRSSGVPQVRRLRMQAGLPCPSAEGALKITESWGLEGQS